MTSIPMQETKRKEVRRMNLSKSLEFFDPINDYEGAIHVIGIGAMGSRIAELLVRLGIQRIHIWDFDTVEDKNITNQLYFHHQIGMKKTDALQEILKDINPTCEVKIHDKWEGQTLAGYVFLCVDSIELRHEITMKLEDVMINAKYVLKNKGELYLVHRCDRLEEIVSLLNKYNFSLKKLQFIYSNMNKEAIMVLVKATKNGKTGSLKVMPPVDITKYKSYQGMFEMSD